MSGKLRLEGKLLTQALKMLDTVTSILDKHNIPYWLEGGTLLGVVRENRLLPWDNDVDISIYVDDLDKLMSILNKFRFRGYYVRIKKYLSDEPPFKQNDVRIVKIHNRQLLVAKGRLVVDIFIKSKLEDMYFWGVGVKKFVMKSVPAAFYEELISFHFNGKDYSIPKDYDGYLTYRYGDWKKPQKKWRFLKDDLAIIGKNSE